jgi:hypothetical protein
MVALHRKDYSMQARSEVLGKPAFFLESEVLI